MMEVVRIILPCCRFGRVACDFTCQCHLECTESVGLALIGPFMYKDSCQFINKTTENTCTNCPGLWSFDDDNSLTPTVLMIGR